jgi:hypothetical protein
MGPVLSAPDFWALMERWRISDPVALELIQYPGKMPRSGKRPRFRLLSSQQRLTSYLAELEAALAAAGHQPEWLHRKSRAFAGRSPLDIIIQEGTGGAAEVLRALNRAAMKKALALTP